MAGKFLWAGPDILLVRLTESVDNTQAPDMILGGIDFFDILWETFFMAFRASFIFKKMHFSI